MGIRQIDLVPPQITPITPPGKDHLIKVVQATRSDTVATVKAQLPAGCSPYRLYLSGGPASDAGTSATLTVTIANNSGTVSSGTANLLSGGVGASTSIINMSNLPLVVPQPLNGDYTVSVTYAETGTASTTGGPWKLSIEFIS